MSAPPSRVLFPALASVANRSCYLRDGVISSFVVPGDWVPTAQADAFVGNYQPAAMLGDTSHVAGNEVEFYVDGHDTYEAISDELDDILDSSPEERAGCLVIHVGWTCHLDTQLGSRGSYQSYMEHLATAGVKTRALYWAGSMVPDLAPEQVALVTAANFINDLLPTGIARAYTDAQNRSSGPNITTGSHHQKLWIILRRRTLTAYFGGVDVHTNRIRPIAAFLDPYHDVHARVRGPAAERFLGIVLWRLMGAVDWSPDHVPAPDATPPAAPSSFSEIGRSPLRLPLAELHEHQVSVHDLYVHWNSRKSHVQRRYAQSAVRVHAGSTVGNPAIQAAGFTSEIRDMISRAIQQAHRFVYVEDQYLWHHGMAQLLGRRVSEGAIKLLIIVTNVSEFAAPRVKFAEHPPHTRLGLWHLAHAAGSHTDRILVFERIGDTGRYVHTKAFIYDDVCAHVGSANFNKRGYSHDSESAGVWVDRVEDTTSWHSVENTLARKLRVKLWEKHLGIEPAYLYDALGASVYWQELATRTGSRPARVGPGRRPASVQIATLDHQPWPAWARAHSTLQPDEDVSCTDVHSTDCVEWLVDPD